LRRSKSPGAITCRRLASRRKPGATRSTRSSTRSAKASLAVRLGELASSSLRNGKPNVPSQAGKKPSEEAAGRGLGREVGHEARSRSARRRPPSPENCSSPRRRTGNDPRRARPTTSRRRAAVSPAPALSCGKPVARPRRRCGSDRRYRSTSPGHARPSPRANASSDATLRSRSRDRSAQGPSAEGMRENGGPVQPSKPVAFQLQGSNHRGCGGQRVERAERVVDEAGLCKLVACDGAPRPIGTLRL